MATNLLEGNMRRQLLMLSLPLILGNILQQLYNAMDSIIIGRYVGAAAFAAVGVSGTVMNLFIFIISGVCTGVSVLFAQLYGARDYDGYRRESFLALTFGGGFTLLLMAVSSALLPLLLRLIQTPPDVAEASRQYLQVIFAGLIATYLYNLFSAMLRSVGNTQTTLVFLAVAAVLNAGLDLLFVAGMGMGIRGAAIATVIAQAASALCSALYIMKHIPFAIFRRGDMQIDTNLLRKTSKFGLVSGLHQSSLYIGKLLVQGAVNSLGTASIVAYTAATRIEGFANSFADSGAESISVFVAQNTGAGQKKRSQDGLRSGLFMMCTMCVAVSVIMYAGARQMVAFFIGGGELLELTEGVSYLKVIAVFYVFCFIGASFVGFFRGSGRVNMPVIGTTVHISIRVVLSYLLADRMGLAGVAIATGIGWMVVVCLHGSAYLWTRGSVERPLAMHMKEKGEPLTEAEGHVPK